MVIHIKHKKTDTTNNYRNYQIHKENDAYITVRLHKIVKLIRNEIILNCRISCDRAVYLF